jgi:hypothetical protein
MGRGSACRSEEIMRRSKGDIFDTADTGQIIKARIDTHREEQPGGSRPPFFQVTATEI